MDNKDIRDKRRQRELGGTRWMGLTGIGVLGLVGAQCVTGVGFIAVVVHSFTC